MRGKPAGHLGNEVGAFLDISWRHGSEGHRPQGPAPAELLCLCVLRLLSRRATFLGLSAYRSVPGRSLRLRGARGAATGAATPSGRRTFLDVGRAASVLLADLLRRGEESVEHRVERRVVGLVLDEGGGERIAERHAVDSGVSDRLQGVEGLADADAEAGHAQSVNEVEQAVFHRRCCVGRDA